MEPLDPGTETDLSPRGTQVEFFQNLKQEPKVLYSNYLLPTMKENLTTKSFLMSVLRVIVISAVVSFLIISLAIFALPFVFIQTPSRCEVLSANLEKFKKVEIVSPINGLSPSNRAALNSLYLLQTQFDTLFLRQVYENNEELLETIEKGKECGGVLEEFFKLNFGPWDRIDGNKSFVPSVTIKKPLGANFYPLDMKAEEFNNWVKTLSVADQEKAKGPHYVVKRTGGTLGLVSYADEYKTELTKISTDLKIAAGYIEDVSLKSFLNERADAFLSNDYRQSEASWINVDTNSTFEITIGPYETKEDSLFGLKGAFTMTVLVVDQQETKEANQFQQYFQELNANLPMNSTYMSSQVPVPGPIVIGSIILQAGFASQTIQSSAYNVHMYDNLVSTKGTKKVVLMNIQQGKYNDLISPLSKMIISELQQKYLSFDGYFTRNLGDQIIQGLGPHNITVNGVKTTVRSELKEFALIMDSVKSDSGSLWMLHYLLNQNKISYEYTLKPELARDNFISKKDKKKRTVAVTYVAALFRKVRFGVSDDIGRAARFILVYLIKAGAVIVENEIIDEVSSLRLSVDFGSFEFVAGQLFGEVLNIQAAGDRKAAETLLNENEKLSTELEELIKKVDKTELPIDILPLIGATGSQGGSVVKELLKLKNEKKDIEIVTITRDPTKESAKKLEEQGVVVFKGDLSDKKSIEEVYKQKEIDYVFLVTQFWEKFDQKLEEEHGKNFIDVTKEHGKNVKLLVYSSLENVEKLVEGKYKVPHFDSKGNVAEYLHKSGIPYAEVMVSFYSQNFLGFFPPKKNEEGELVFSFPLPHPHKMDIIDISQLGSLVVHLFENQKDWNGKVLTVGEGSYTGQEIVDIFTKVSGKKAVFKGFTPEEGKKIVGDEMANMFQFYIDFEGKLRDSKKCREINPKLNTLEDFFKNHESWWKAL
eukprot:gene6702-10867_t